MSKCKNCKAPLGAKEKFCGKCGQPVKKSRLSPLAIILIILATLLLLGVIIWSLRFNISKLTNGKLFGFRATDITSEEMQGDIAPPSEKEIKKFRTYAEGLQDYGESKLWGTEKTAYQELNAVFYMIADCAMGETTLSIDTLEKEFNKALKDVKFDQSVLGDLFATTSMTVYASESNPGIPTDKNAYLAYMLKDSATALFLQGQTDMALSMASMAAALTPEDSSMANLLANILKEYNMTDTSYEMLQYALRLNPNDEAALHTLGMLCIDMEKYDEAEHCFNRMLTLSGGTGPANQGWMLLALAEGDLPSAYLYMLEGARDGYIHTITEVYEAFRARSDYFEIAGPIFDQYPLYELVKFKRTQQVFDATLDTIEQQVVIDRELKLCHDAGGAMLAQPANMLESKRYLEETVGLITNNFISYLSTFEDDFAKLQGILSDPDVKDLLGGDLTALWSLNEKYAVPEDPANVYEYSYEQEIFFLNILQDYLEYNLEKNLDQYLDSAINKMDISFPGNPLGDYMDRWREYGVEVNTVFKPLQKWDGVELTPTNIYAYMYDALPSLQLLNKNFETNGHGMYYGQFTKEQFANLNKAIEEIYPLLEKGYVEQVILCEEYYLYSNNILGYIADNDIYNEWRYYQQLNIQFPLLYYPMAGSFYNGMLAMGATVTWGDAAPIGDATIHMPATPEFPITGMGTPTGEPVIIWEYQPPPSQALEDSAEILWEETIQDDLESIMAEEGFTENNPELYISFDPENNKPAEATTTVDEGIDTSFRFSFKLGKLIEASVDPHTGDITFGVGAILGSAKASANLLTGDLTLYVHGGPDADIGLELGNASLNFGGAKVGGYGKLSVNVYDGKLNSAEVGADLGFNIAGIGAETEVGYDFASSVKRDTASLLLGSVKTTKTTTTPVK